MRQDAILGVAGGLLVLAAVGAWVISPDTEAAYLAPTAPPTNTARPALHQPPPTFTRVPSVTPERIDEPTATATATATPDPVAVSLMRIEGIESVRAYNLMKAGRGTMAYFEIDTLPGYNNEAMAAEIYSAAVGLLMMRYDDIIPVSFSVILWDGVGPAVSWMIDYDTDTWGQTVLSVTPEPVDICDSYETPANCDAASQLGLSAADVARCWPKLDRDKDGVACFGD